MRKIMIHCYLLLFVRIFLPDAGAAQFQIAILFVFPMPGLECLFIRITQLLNGRCGAFSKLYIASLPDYGVIVG